MDSTGLNVNGLVCSLILNYFVNKKSINESVFVVVSIWLRCARRDSGLFSRISEAASVLLLLSDRSNEICKVLLPDVGSYSQMFMLSFETRDSKHCCLMLFSRFWTNIMLVVLCFIMARRSQSTARSYFWCERLARGSVQNLLKTKGMCFSLRLCWLDVLLCLMVPLSGFETNAYFRFILQRG